VTIGGDLCIQSCRFKCRSLARRELKKAIGQGIG